MSLSKQTKKWIEKNCLKSLKSKTVLITGANSGVGFKEAETAVYLGARVIMACRNLHKAETVKEKLLSEYPDTEIQIFELNLADFSSIDSFVLHMKNQNLKIDAFVNNAGVFHVPGEKTKDGLELILGTNYFGTYYLTEKMLPYFEQTGNPVIYINTISIIHKIASINYDDFYFSKNYRNFPVYARSKLCLAKYTWYMAQKYKDTNIRILMNHPGMTITPMGLNAFGSKVARLSRIAKYCINSTEKSALSVVYMMSKEFKPGSIIGPNKGFGGWGYPKENHVYKKVRTGGEELIRFTEKECKRILKSKD